MSRAIICDKCGLVMEESRKMDVYSIWLANPIIFDGDDHSGKYQVHLCGKHYKEFEDEYLANLKETYGQDMG